MYPNRDAFLGGIGKFDSRFDQWLYTDVDPDESIGDSTDGPGWFARYGIKRIMLEQTNGFVVVHKYDTAEACLRDWDAIVESFGTDEEWI